VFLRGRCTGFLGHNGAGKTTTIRAIFILIKRDKGNILFKSKPIVASDHASIGYMPEVLRLPLGLNAVEILKHHLRVVNRKGRSKSADMDLIQSLLQKVGLWDVRYNKVATYSKGMGRRLSWVVATIHDPELLILDEPCSGLDPVGRGEMLSWIKELKSQGKAIILCTHELWFAQQLCDEAYILRSGKIACSSLSEIISDCSYEIVVSGTNEQDLENLRVSQKLKTWVKFSQEGFLCRMRIKDYSAASEWLRVILEKGFIVIKFSDELSVEDKKVYELFGGIS
jgi:ABC-2 type transport system ATP-binding protein